MVGELVLTEAACEKPSVVAAQLEVDDRDALDVCGGELHTSAVHISSASICLVRSRYSSWARRVCPRPRKVSVSRSIRLKIFASCAAPLAASQSQLKPGNWSWILSKLTR